MYLPFSVVIVLGLPNIAKTKDRNFITAREVIVDTSCASTHLVK